MKKILFFIMIIISIEGYSQKNNCYCPPKKKISKIVKKTYNKKKIELPKQQEVVKNTSIIVNNTFNFVEINNHESTRKDTLHVIAKENKQSYELYAGVVKNNNTSLLGYSIGFNVINNLNQINNKFLFGFGYSFYSNRSVLIKNEGSSKDSSVINETCNCQLSDLGSFANSSEYKITSSLKSYSLNLGIEVIKELLLTGGITYYDYKTYLNQRILNNNNEMLLDIGLKKMIKVNNNYINPSIKVNKRFVEISIGYSFLNN